MNVIENCFVLFKPIVWKERLINDNFEVKCFSCFEDAKKAADEYLALGVKVRVMSANLLGMREMYI